MSDHRQIGLGMGTALFGLGATLVYLRGLAGFWGAGAVSVGIPWLKSSLRPPSGN